MKTQRLVFACVIASLFATTGYCQTWTGTVLQINDATYGINGDYTEFYRVDPQSDFTQLRLRMGDEETSMFDIGFNHYSTGQWYSSFNVNGYGTASIRGNFGIGTSSPGAKLSFNNVDDGSNGADGITWYNPAPLNYGIYRTAGVWSSPNYQQLKLSFETGIILNPGSLYGKSYVDIQGGGLRVSSGNVGIGLSTPSSRLHVVGNGGTNIDFKVNGRISSGDASDAGGMYLGSANNMFVGQASANSLGFYNNGSWRLIADQNGNVGIGTVNPDQKLTVNGNIHAKEVKVDLSVPGPDYVFDESYPLTPLEELKKYIDEHRHLPEVPSAKEMEANGINLMEMNVMLLRKIEELTLHLIEQQNQLTQLREAGRVSAESSAKKVEELTLHLIESNSQLKCAIKRIEELETSQK